MIFSEIYNILCNYNPHYSIRIHRGQSQRRIYTLACCIFQNMEFNLVASRYAQAALLRAQKKGETTVDISKPGEEEEEETV